MIGGSKGIGAGIVRSVTGPGGSEGTVAALPQQLPMGGNRYSGNDGYDDRSRCLRRETRGPRVAGPSEEPPNSWCLRVGSSRKRSSRILANNNREHTRDLRVKSSEGGLPNWPTMIVIVDCGNSENSETKALVLRNLPPSKPFSITTRDVAVYYRSRILTYTS